MCLGDVGRVTAIDADGCASVDIAERTVSISTLLLDVPPSVGDWLVVHAGFALGSLSEDEARETLSLRHAAGWSR